MGTLRFWGRGLVLLAVLLALAGVPAHAQIAPDSARLVAKLSLTRLFYATYELEAEYRLSPRFSLTLAPRALAGTVPAVVSEVANAADDQVRGYGLSLGSRFYLPNSGGDGALLAGLYFGLQADYYRLNLHYQAEAWGEDLGADGLRYYNYRYRDGRETISRYGGTATLGYQCQVFHPRLRLDASASLSRLHSTSRGANLGRYNSSATDYGHSGTFWNLNLGMGFVLK
jgi:hypothetical protein